MLFRALGLLAMLIVPGIASTPTAAQTTPTPRRPNILWISNEDMSPHLGAYGDCTCPHAGAGPAGAGSRFDITHAFTTAPVCAPSRAAIITGMYQNVDRRPAHAHDRGQGARAAGPYLAVPPFYVKAFPEYLRAAGYYTSNRAKTDYQFGVPFTIWDDLGANAHWRNRRDKTQPFFSVFNIEVTHESQIFPTSPARKGKPLVTDPEELQVPPYYPDTPAVREELARMYDNIADMDARVGEILKQLEEDGLADNTIVFYWSDHGDGVPRAKRSLYDSGLRVPLMIRWPKALKPAVQAWHRQRSARELHRPRADRARAGGRRRSRASPGASTRRTERGAGARIRFCRARPHGYRIRHDAAGARHAVPLYPQLPRRICRMPASSRTATRAPSCRSGSGCRRKGKLTGPPALWMRTSRPAEELYDTDADPHQINNLAADPAHRATLERMRSAVTSWMTQIGDQGLINEPEMIQRMWPGGVQPETAPALHRAAASDGRETRCVGHRDSGPMEVVIYVPTQGASIGYTTEEGPKPTWRLYTGPILITPPMTIRAKAIRYGYKESTEAKMVIGKEASTVSR